MKFKTGDYIGVSIVTIAALVLMFTIGAGRGGWGLETGSKSEQTSVVIPKSPVSVMQVEPESIEITLRYAGVLRPLEDYQMAFEIGGRIESMATRADGTPLDVGDSVTAGQVLAQLDDRLLRARLKGARARLEQAQSDLQRAEELQSRSPNAISPAQMQEYITAVIAAEAELEASQKSLDDVTLRAPVDGVVSQRMANPGESINMHQPIFEVLEVDELVLVVGVPESRIQEIRVGQKAHLELLAHDIYGRPRPSIDGVVHTVGEASAMQTGLFEVEIRVPNESRELKPGLIARTHIVIREIEGFRLPSSAAVFRDNEWFLFAVGEDGLAHRYVLGGLSLEQGEHIVVTDLPEPMRTVVTRGQHRLVEGREVEIVDVNLDEPGVDVPAVNIESAVSVQP